MSSAVTRPMGTWKAQVGAETTLDTAASQTGSNNNMTEPADRHTMDKTVRPLFLRDPKTLYTLAEVRNANTNLSSVVIEIGKHVLDMEQAVIDGDLPRGMLYSYSDMLGELISKGEALLKEYETKVNALVAILSDTSLTPDSCT